MNDLRKNGLLYFTSVLGALLISGPVMAYPVCVQNGGVTICNDNGVVTTCSGNNGVGVCTNSRGETNVVHSQGGTTVITGSSGTTVCQDVNGGRVCNNNGKITVVPGPQNGPGGGGRPGYGGGFEPGRGGDYRNGGYGRGAGYDHQPGYGGGRGYDRGSGYGGGRGYDHGSGYSDRQGDRYGQQPGSYGDSYQGGGSNQNSSEPSNYDSGSSYYPSPSNVSSICVGTYRGKFASGEKASVVITSDGRISLKARGQAYSATGTCEATSAGRALLNFFLNDDDKYRFRGTIAQGRDFSKTLNLDQFRAGKQIDKLSLKEVQ